MPREEASPFLKKNPPALGFSGDRRRSTKTSLCKGAAVTIFFLAAILMISYTFGHSTEKPNTRKSKRHLLDQDKMSAQNVHIVPEKRPTLRELLEDIGNQQAPRPFESTAEKHRGSSKNVAEGQKQDAEMKFISGLARGLMSSMRLKGIYMQPVSKGGNHLKEKFNYSEEINNLMQKGLGSGSKDGRRTSQKAREAPFELPAKRRPRVPRPPPLTHSRPITILLDFYPMTGNKNPSQIEKFLDGEGKGLIMKLKLYPGKGARPLETAERKSFGWFSKDKKNKKTDIPKSCSFLGLDHLGKRVSAKWKNKNGDWIHAKRVSVKYWDKTNNRNG